MVSIDSSSECKDLGRTVPDSCSDWEQAQQHQQLTEETAEAAAPDARTGGMAFEGTREPCPGDAIDVSYGEAETTEQVSAQTVGCEATWAHD